MASAAISRLVCPSSCISTNNNLFSLSKRQNNCVNFKASVKILTQVCICDSLQKESVALALRLIDESEVRGYRLHVEAARFELKGQYDASKKKKKSKDYRKRMQQQQK